MYQGMMAPTTTKERKLQFPDIQVIVPTTNFWSYVKTYLFLFYPNTKSQAAKNTL